MACLTMQLLGGVSVWLNPTGRIRPPGRKSVALLAYLASDPGKAHSRSELSTLLWGRHDTDHARGSLRQTLKLLRGSLHRQERPIIRADGDRIYVDPDMVETDAQLVERLSRSSDSAELRRAAAAYQGEFMADFHLDEHPFEEWLRGERRRYHDLAIALLRRLQDRHLADGSTRRALQIAERLLKLDPTQEDVHRSVMAMFLDLGYRNRAIQQYSICREVLRAELDVRPERATESLYESIRGESAGPGARDPAVAPGAQGAHGAQGAPVGGVAAERQHAPGEPEELPFPQLPSIAILPLRNLAGDAGDKYYVEGLRYELQAALIKVSDLLLIAPACVDPYRDSPDAAERAARDLDIDYVLEGSLRRDGAQIDAAFRLTNTELRRIVWAKRCVTTHMGEMLNEIVLGILESLHIDVHAGEEARIFQHTVSSPAARESFYLGTNLGYSMTKEGNAAARAAFREVVRLQPDSPVGPTYISFTYWLDVFRGWTAAPDRQLAKGVAWARRALELSDANGLAYIVLSHEHLLRDRHREALATSFKAVDFRPNCPTANGFLGYVLLHCGRPTEAVEWIRRAMRRSPKYPPWFVNVLAAAYRDSGDYPASIRTAHISLEISPADVEARAILCTDLVLTGDRQRAIRVGREIAGIRPSFSRSDYVKGKHYRDRDTAALIESSLADAQLPA